ncbi:MAG: hypothetical protein DRJ45_02360 [Thermoprotei archaeon]|nr:MAG: hypothetical protein DRJ45_02360 [Thermoprotei archaeon]
MIIDTTYILPLAAIDVKPDLLRAIIEDKVKLKVKLTDLKLSLISLFELQAKASKLNIPSSNIIKAINTILKTFKIIPFYEDNIIKRAYEIRKVINDYIDCIVVSTAIVLHENLITEDTEIIAAKEFILKKYGIKIFSYKDVT